MLDPTIAGSMLVERTRDMSFDDLFERRIAAFAADCAR